MKLIQDQFSDLSEKEKQLFTNFSEKDQERLYAFAFELYRNGKYLESKKFFQFLTLLNPFQKKFWIGFGASLQLLKEYHQAIQCYSVAAVQDPDDPMVHFHAADCFFATGALAVAIKTLESSKVAAAKQANAQLLTRLDTILEAWKSLEIKQS